MTAVYFFIRRLVLGAFTSSTGIELSVSRLKLIAAVYFEHFRLFVFPFILNALYVDRAVPFTMVKGAVAITGILLLLYFSLAKRTPSPVRAGAQWIFWGLLLVSNIVKIPSAPVADRYQYTIIFGFVLILGYLLAGLQKKRIMAGAAMTFAIVIPLSARTFMRNFIWKDSFSLYSSLVRSDPENPIARYDLGVSYMKRGDPGDAYREFKTALSINPGLPMAWMNLGVISAQRGLAADSERQLSAALDLDPRLSEAHLDLGVTYYREGRLPDSVRELKAALAIDPRFVQAWLNLGIAYEDEGQTEKAIQGYRMAAQLAPGLLKAHLLLGKCYQKEGFPDEAAREFQIVRKLDPGNASGH